MDENIEVLQDVYKASEMAVYGLEKICKNLKNNKTKIANVVRSELKQYKKYKEKSKELLDKNDYEPQQNSFFAKLGSSMEINMKVSPEDLSMVSEILTKGLKSGIKKMEDKLNNYKGKLNKDTEEFVKEFLDYQKEEETKLKEYM